MDHSHLPFCTELPELAIASCGAQNQASPLSPKLSSILEARNIWTNHARPLQKRETRPCEMCSETVRPGYAHYESRHGKPPWRLLPELGCALIRRRPFLTLRLLSSRFPDVWEGGRIFCIFDPRPVGSPVDTL